MPHTVFTPPALQQLGYLNYPSIVELGAKAFPNGFTGQSPDDAWEAWRGYLEYMACVEFGRRELHSLPTGAALGSIHVVPAQYHSAALVFAAQALLDNIAEWLRTRLGLGITHPQTAFHKQAFRTALTASDSVLGALVDNHSAFINQLERFRHAWIHRISGGARIFSDADPSTNPSALRIRVPIDPKIGTARGQEYIEAIEACKVANAGRWLYDIGEFADRFADGTRGLVLAVLAHELART